MLRGILSSSRSFCHRLQFGTLRFAAMAEDDKVCKCGRCGGVKVLRTDFSALLFFVYFGVRNPVLNLCFDAIKALGSYCYVCDYMVVSLQNKKRFKTESPEIGRISGLNYLLNFGCYYQFLSSSAAFDWSITFTSKAISFS